MKPRRLLLLLALAGCRQPESSGPIDVSVIGPSLAEAISESADSEAPDMPAAVLLAATGQGLLRFDASGQIVPGLATRWTVTDSGRSLIFRLPDDPPPGAPAIDAEAIARRIRAAAAPGGANPLRPLLGAIGDVEAVTPQVIDVEMTAPRPNMLQLFAQPGLAFGGQAGPMAIATTIGGVATLRPLAAPAPDPGEPPAPSPPLVNLRGESAGRAIARFVAGRASLVLGGRFNDLLVARMAAPPRDTLRFDPVSGLFGLAFTTATGGFTADPARRRALSMAIDRDRIARTFAAPGWIQSTAIVALSTPEIARPTAPDWTAMAFPDRQATARGIVTGWHGAGRAPAPIRVAMPAGPGARILFGLIAADWRAIGIAAVQVGPGDPADLRLIDEVAPADVASFYLRAFACDRGVPCSAIGDATLIAARETPSLAERSAYLARADGLIDQIVPFIPFGAPIRWSLVSPSLDLYRDSPRGVHPLIELRSPLKR